MNTDNPEIITMHDGTRIKDTTGRLRKAIEEAKSKKAFRRRFLTIAAFLNERAFRIEIPPSGFPF